MKTEVEFFQEHVPDSLLRSLLRGVFDSCSGARVKADECDKRFRGDALPQLRRVGVESMLSQLLLPKGFTSRVISTTSSNYTEISSANVVITAMTRTRHVDTVPAARYRETLARGRQILMFDESPHNGMCAPGAAQLHALLIYGGSHRDAFPTMARLTFPDRNGVIVDEINLLKKFPDIVDQYRNPASRAPRAQVKLKKLKPKEQGEA